MMNTVIFAQSARKNCWGKGNGIFQEMPELRTGYFTGE